jgi:hypothetical protein
MFELSRGIQKHRQNPVFKRNYRAQGWKFDGTVDEFSLKMFCREEKIVFDDFIRVRATFLLIYEYPTIFYSYDDG